MPNLKKSWTVLITCCSTRSTYLDVLPNCYGHSCREVLKQFRDIHGASKVIISGNGPSFNEEVKAFTSSKGIIWKHNMQKAPWMGGIFETMIRCSDV